MVMFLAIMNSLPLQALQARQKQQQMSASSAGSTVTTGVGKKQVSAGAESLEASGAQDNMTKSMMGGLSIPCVKSTGKGDIQKSDFSRKFYHTTVSLGSLNAWRIVP